MWSIEKLLRREKLTVRKVTRQEFIDILVGNGSTLANAEIQVKWAIGMGSEVMVGDEYLTIKETPK